MYILKEPGCDKWIAPRTSSGFSSNKDDAQKFDKYLSVLELLSIDVRYRGLKFTDLSLVIIG